MGAAEERTHRHDVGRHRERDAEQQREDDETERVQNVGRERDRRRTDDGQHREQHAADDDVAVGEREHPRQRPEQAEAETDQAVDRADGQTDDERLKCDAAAHVCAD